MSDDRRMGAQEALLYAVYKNPSLEREKEFVEYTKENPDKAIQFKRLLIVMRTLEDFLDKFGLPDVYTLDRVALRNVARDYIQDLKILKIRYTCDTVQLPKIAGLMTNILMRYRPVVPVDRAKNPYSAINEVFAVYHALCICSDFSNGTELEDYSKRGECRDFYEDMVYLLRRTYSAESLIMVFKVLCQDCFKSFKNKDVPG